MEKRNKYENARVFQALHNTARSETLRLGLQCIVAKLSDGGREPLRSESFIAGGRGVNMKGKG